MKATEKFKDAIKRYLDERASQDELFAISYAKEHKNLDECINYILRSVQASFLKAMGKGMNPTRY